jgi:hypothetical protein
VQAETTTQFPPAPLFWSEGFTVQRKEPSSKYRGVYFVKRDKCWRSKITVNDMMIVLGNFTDEFAAALAYNAAALKYHGQFAVLNVFDGEGEKAA